MGFGSGGIFSNIFIFIAGLCGVFNIKIAYRTLRNGSSIEKLIKENLELKEEVERLKNGTTGA